MLPLISLLKSPSTIYSLTTALILSKSSSEIVSILRLFSIFNLSKIALELVNPIP
jgi:hypothetical protein